MRVYGSMQSDSLLLVALSTQEHVHIENEIEKELQRAGDRGGIRALLQVTPSSAIWLTVMLKFAKSTQEFRDMCLHSTIEPCTREHSSGRAV